MAVAVMAKLMRLDKYLVEMNKGSRTQIKDAAKKGRIQVNGVPEKKTERKIDPETDEVSFDSQPVSYRAMEYIMLYKPQGVISATEDKHHKTVIDLLSGENRSDLFPVGRLDIDTEGLLLLTNDGDLTHRLLAPGKHVDKVYFARIEGVLPETAVEQMAAGLTLTDGTPVMPGKLEILKQWNDETCTKVSETFEDATAADRPAGAEILLTIQEGKFHQVKRMFEALGCKVVFLKRLSMGNLVLDPDLPFQELLQDVIEKFKASEKFFKNAQLAISFEGRKLSEDEENRIITAITDHTSIQILCIVQNGSDQEAAMKQQIEYYQQIQQQYASMNSGSGDFYRGTLRSGQVIESESSVTIIGDVNPGAKIISGGNIVILGALKGNAHAGSGGDRSCFIFALDMNPIQIQIGDLIAKSPDKEKTKRSMFRREKAHQTESQIAIARDGNIYIEPVTRDVMNRM